VVIPMGNDAPLKTMRQLRQEFPGDIFHLGYDT
jgi:hypothetical protein